MDSESASASSSGTKKRVKEMSEDQFPEFRKWLKRDENDNKLFFCTVCKKYLKGDASEINKHASKKKHEQNYALFNADSKNKTSSHAEMVKRAEVHLREFAAKHEMSEHDFQHLIGIIDKLCPDSAIAKGVKLNMFKPEKKTNENAEDNAWKVWEDLCDHTLGGTE